jgi:DNA-directed RNA polymerase beta subunit
MKDKHILSSSLCSVPFLFATDSTRTQMTAKQMNQALLNEHCEHPYVIGDAYGYLSENSPYFKYICEEDSKILYYENNLMILYMKESGNLKYFDLPKFRETHSRFAVTLKYVSDKIELTKGDLLFSYHGFSNSTQTPQYGFNCYTLYSPFFGFTHEDAIVVSESLAKKLYHYKTEKLVIPIYSDTKLKPVFNSKPLFFPWIGDNVPENVFCYTSVERGNGFIKPHKMTLNEMSDNNLYNTIPIKTKLYNAKVEDIRVHRISNGQLVLKHLDVLLNKLVEVHQKKIANIRSKLEDIFLKNESMINSIIEKYFHLTTPKQLNDNVSDLVYVIEVTLSKRHPDINEPFSELEGDKLTQRYGGKGVISLVLPDELMPTDELGNRIELVTSPLSVPGRSNYGQIFEGIVSNVIHTLEQKLLKENSPDITKDVLNDVLKICKVMFPEDHKYLIEIQTLIKNMDSNKELHDLFISDIRENGFFITAPVFADNKRESNLFRNLCDVCNEVSFKHGGLNTFDRKITFKKELINKMNQEILKNNLPETDTDLIVDDVFVGYIYYMILYKIAKDNVRIRDVGSVNNITGMSTKRDSSEFPGCRTGYMEINAFFSHGCTNITQEIFGPKSDNTRQKTDMHVSMITNGEFDMTTTPVDNSPTRKTIESYLNFLNN